mgnify:CR=1 FL=1
MNTLQKLYIKTIKLFIIPCEQASLLLTKKEYDKLTLRESWNLRLHMIKCKYCRWFKKEDSLLTKTIINYQNKIDNENLPYCLSLDKIEEMKKNISSL